MMWKKLQPVGWSLLMLVSFFFRPASAVQEGIDQSTPRKAWESFSRACWDQDYDLAGLVLRPRKDEDTRTLAKKFCEVAHHLLRVNPSQLSDEPFGKKIGEGDSYGEITESVGQILGTSSADDIVRLRLKRETKQWFFHYQVLGNIDRWYKMLDDQWLRSRLPSFLQKQGPLNLSLWQWLALPFMLLLAFILGFIIVLLLRLSIRPFLKPEHALWNPDLPNRLKRPLRLFLAAIFAQIALPLLYINLRVQEVLEGFLHLVSAWAGVWVLLRMLHLIGEHIGSSSWMKVHPNVQHIVPLGLRAAKFLLFLIGVVLSIRALGYSITSLVAGLGIGGVAVVFAAQKTLEQIFGGIVLSVDQPMRVGDQVKVGEFTGVVEYIGLRSTRIRTPDRTMLTIPNGKLAEMNIESLAARDRIRSVNTLKLEYSSKVSQIQSLLTAIKNQLSTYPKIWPHEIQVFLKALGEHSLEIEINFWLQTTEFLEFAKMRQEILLEILTLVEKQGTLLAISPKTVQLISGK